MEKLKPKAYLHVVLETKSASFPMMKRLLFGLIILLQTLPGLCQLDNKVFYEPLPCLDSTTGKVVLAIDNLNFLKNNEYFSDYAKGYTTLGFQLIPKLTYTYNKSLHFQVGANLLKFSGRNTFQETAPYLRVLYTPTPDLHIVLGNIYGAVQHELPEPLMDPERLLTHNDESGLQFLYHRGRFAADLWVHWSQFILEGDPFQEKFTVGFSGHYTLLSSQHLSLSIPGTFLASHSGGQINSNDESLSTLINSCVGLRLKTHNTPGDSLIFMAQVFTYEDQSPNPKQTYQDGEAFLVQVTQHYRHLQINLGYWWARDYIAPMGHPLYLSVSDYKPYIESRYRRMAIGKAAFQKPITRDLRLGVRAEGFLDLKTNKFDYLYAFYLQFNPRFFITRIKP